MDKRYSPLDIEEKWANIWKDNPLPNIKSDSKFSQVIPSKRHWNIAYGT